MTSRAPCLEMQSAVLHLKCAQEQLHGNQATHARGGLICALDSNDTPSSMKHCGLLQTV